MLIHRIRLKNLLSFGPQGVELELEPLNVLIGPNGSGKSNLIEVMGFLKAAPEDPDMTQENGGYAGWIWHGEPDGSPAEIEAVVAGPDGRRPLRYHLLFNPRSKGLRLIEETVQDEASQSETEPRVYLHSDGQKATARHSDPDNGVSQKEIPSFTTLHRPALAHCKYPDEYPELAYMAEGLSGMSLYRQWYFGRHTPPRSPQNPDLPSNILVENLQNLGLVLIRLMQDDEVKQRLVKALGDLYEGVSGFRVNIEHNTVEILFQEGEVAVPATRLSDGTLRYLCLLVILCDPNPPPLVCIEEPELGFHPDILPGLADLLRDASERCQLIVTTHSDVLIDALSATPESIVVCEKHEGQTTLKRLDRDDLDHWLEKYSLGDLWTSGELGGNRW